MLTRVSGVDSVSLHTQTSTAPAHTIALIIIEASDQLSHERLHQLVASSLPKLVRFRSRLVGKALGLGRPVWAEIDDYDPTPQIHRAAVHAPGGRREFAALIAQLSSAPPGGHQLLWEAWSIEGLAGGRWALAIKMSPVLSEQGNGAASIWSRLLTSRPQDTRPDNLPAEPGLGSAPSIGELVTDVVAEIFEVQVAGTWLIAATAARALQALQRRLRGAEDAEPITAAMPSMSGPVPDNVFHAPLTTRRAVAFTSIPLCEVEKVSKAFGGSTANVFLAACTLSLRAWLLRYDSVPENPLLMQAPLSLPASDPAVSKLVDCRASSPPSAARRPGTGPQQPPYRDRKTDYRPQRQCRNSIFGSRFRDLRVVDPTVGHPNLYAAVQETCAGPMACTELPRQCLLHIRKHRAVVLCRCRGRRYAHRGAGAGWPRVGNHGHFAQRRDGSVCARVP